MLIVTKSIPPPIGCDQCHFVAIKSNWKMIYQSANVADERGRLHFQTPQYNWQPPAKARASMDMKSVEEKACFDCHRSPLNDHKGKKGRYNH